MKRTRLKLLVVIGSILLLMTFLFFRANHSDSQPQDVDRAGEDVKEVKQSNPSANMPAISSTNSVIVSQLIEKDAALECLKRWIKRREGKDVKIVDTQDILDLQGKPTCVNVLVSTRLEGLNVETLKQQLDANAVREHELRGELQKAYQETNIAAADQLVAEIRDARTTFEQTNELATYKVSLSKERPPVLAFWPGLPSEAVREEAARNLAANTLGEDIGIQSLVYYTGATTLLCFTNRAGGSIYIDPFRVLEVPMSEIQSPRPSTGKPDDDHVSVSDVAALWTGFLQP
ncbi:MAG: hypothetical protein WCK27_31595 [Verrucomicrobiota bacterium]